jgi:putative ABC transport system ATP-binding protein
LHFTFEQLINKAMIRLEKINKTYFGAQPLHVLKGIDLEVNEGEMVSIMGASGSGKSTLLNILGILDNYDSGDYYLNGKLVKNLSENEAADVRNRTIGFIFQSFNLIPFKTAMENVALPLYYQNVSRKKRNELALEYLERFGLKEWADHYPNELSGGQKQRVSMARALVTQPKVILADEVMQILREVNQSGITMIIVTHEKGIALRTNKIIHLKDGIIENVEINNPDNIDFNVEIK